MTKERREKEYEEGMGVGMGLAKERNIERRNEREMRERVGLRSG